MPTAKNNVIQLHPHELDEKNELCQCGTTRKESSGNLLFKQTTEWRSESVRSETNILKSTVEVFSKH